MANLRTDNLCGEGGRNAYRGSVFFSRGTASSQSDSFNFSGIAIGTSDFTIEGWLYKTKTGNYPVIFDTRESGNSDAGGFFLGTNSDDYFYFYTQSTNAIKQTIISNFSWYHFALVRTGGTTTLYLNGQVSGTYSDSNNYSNDITKLGTSQQYTGGVQNNWNWGGYLSNIRIVVGSAVYTSAFTPPTSELKAISNTKLLCCQNSDDPTQEETGRTLTGVGNHATVGYNKTQPKVIPPYGVDAGNTFNGAISMNSSAYMNFPTGRTEERFPDFKAVPAASARGLFGGGAQPFSDKLNLIEFITISTTGNTQDFGDLTVARGSHFGCSSNVRGVFAGGVSPSKDNTIDFVTISTTGDASDFGDLSIAASNGSGASNSTRGVFALGNAPTYTNLIDFTTISTGGIGLKFGELTQSRDQGGSCASTTRGLFAGGLITPTPSVNLTNIIDFVTISTTANATNFGDLLQGGSNGIRRCGGLSNATRGLFAGGESTSGQSNIISFVTIATTGDAQDFGDLSAAVTQADNGASSSVRGVFHLTSPANTTLHYVTINTAGNSTDFGDMTSASTVTGMSNGHGGLG